MATISSAKGIQSSEAIAPLLGSDDEQVLHGYVDYRGRPSERSKFGGWRSAAFIFCAGGLDKFAYRGIECNLINYLTGPIGEPMAVAAANVNIWTGLASVMPVVGGFLADSVLGIYRANIITCIVYILGLALTTMSAVLISNDPITPKNTAIPAIVKVLFFISLYLVALAQGFPSSIQVFGADQFDRKHPEESKANSSFFNWWHFATAIGAISAYLIVPYVQENVSWSIGFGILCLAMVVGFSLLLMGNKTYRFVIARGALISSSNQDAEHESLRTNPQETTQNHDSRSEGFPSAQDSRNSSKKYLKAEKALIRLLPIWCTTVMYAIAWAQAPTIFTKQANTVDRSIGQNFSIPSASLRIFIPFTTLCFTPIYDRIFVPVARKMTGNPTGITEIQRIKIGMTISMLNMIIAALVEKKRLQIAYDHGLVDIPTAIVPLSFWWLVPQNALCSLGYVFTQIGMQKFFYDGVPTELRSIGLSIAYGAIGAGNFLSSFLIYAIDKATSTNGRHSWFNDNLNRAHLDYFYFVLAGLGFLGLFGFALLAKSFSEENIEENTQAQHDM